MIDDCEFTILSGFLGSGKTTLLSSYLQSGDVSRIAVIVNDVGEVNIDGAILAVQDGVPMATLSNGCVCCSLTNDLPYTIDALLRERRLSGKPSYTQVILECSGLSDPGGVIRSLGALSNRGLRVRVVTTFACDQNISRDDFPLLAQQVCAAHSVVLTRLDLVTTRQIDDAAAEVKGLGPLARIIVETDPQERAREALALSEDGGPSQGGPSHSEGTFSEHPRIQVFTLRWSAELPWEHVAGWLENLVFYFDSRLLRIKGLIRLQEAEVLLIQGVGQHLDSPRRMPALHISESSLVVICRDACAAELTSLEPALPGLEVTSRNSGTTSLRLARPVAE